MIKARFRGIDVESSGADVVVTGGVVDKREIRSRIQEIRAKLDSIQAQIDGLRSAIAPMQDQKASLQAELSQLRDLLMDTGETEV